MKKFKVYLYLILGIFITLSSINAYSNKNDKNDLYNLKFTERPVYYTTVGTIRSRDEIEINSRINSRIEEVKKFSGEKVNKNELLLKLDDQDLKAKVNSIKDKIEQAKSELKLARKELNRAERLYKSKAISEKKLDHAKNNYTTAVSELASRQEELKYLKRRLSYANIRSPIDGIVAKQIADAGDMATPSKVLMTVFNPDRLMLYAPLRESLIKEVNVGDKVKFYVGALDKNVKGTIKEIVPSVETGSRTFIIKICIGKYENLMPGMFARFSIKIGKEKQLLIPTSFINKIGQLEFIEVKKGEKSEKRLIRTVSAKRTKKRKVISELETPVTIKKP